ncbi:general transcription factor 3C polypeptide 4 [Rhinophrynus dorsalis]
MLEAGVLPVPEPDDPRPRFRLTITKREPAVKILHSVTGLEPLSWSEDHRLSVCTSRCLSLLEVLCDGNGSALELTLHRTSLPIPATSCTLRVGVPEDVERCKEGFAMARDPKISHSFMLDRVFSPVGKFLPPLQGFKYASWSPMGCDENGRCLVAALTLDNRLTVYANLNRLSWRQLVDLTEMYGDHLFEAKYNVHDNDTTSADLGDFTEFKQRHSMQTPVRMEWSGICTTQQIMQNNECKDVGTVLLAVLFENGDIAVWQFQLPFLGKESVISCNTIMSGLNSASVLAWWEYEHSSRKMSGLIVGSSLGPIKILPVNLKAVKGYFTLRQPVVLWQEMDHMPVHCIKSIALNHPYQKCSCSLVVAARGSYVFWCLLLISKAGLNVHNSHVTGLHSLPIISMSVDKQNGTIYTCSVDGKVRQLIPIFTDVALKFEHQLIQLSDLFGVVRSHGISVSPCGAYLACITSEGMRNGIHPVNKTYQVQFVALKTFEEAVAQLLECSNPNLYRQMDLIDLVRWKILKDRVIPQFLQEALDKKLEGSSPYFWRFRLFLLRVWYQSLKKSCSESLWKPSQRDLKALKVDETLAGSSETEEQRGSDGESPSKQTGGKSPSNLSKDGIEVDIGSPSEEEGLREIQQKIESVESHLTREHMKRVLGEVYMHTLITENTSVPTRGICDFLTSNKDCTDRAAKVIIGHIEKKMNKQTFPEHCSLCKEVLTFNDSRKAVCAKGHLWPRCFLTFQACQNLMYRRCLLHDSIARHPVPEDPEWIKKLLRGPCILCDAPVF